MRTIEITVSPTGETNVETKGFSGHRCIQASLFIERAIGSVDKERKTAEYFESSETEVRVNNSSRS